MIARVWHGCVPAERADEYLTLMRTVALPDYRSTEGNRGAWCMTRADGGRVHFEMLTHWADVDAIKRFAGDDYERAKYYDFDEGFLIELEPHVRHYDVYDS